MKGILLAGGRGTRLHPATKATSKHLLHVYDKPMIYYPLSTLMLAGIRNVLVISTPEDLPQFKRLFGDFYLGVNFSYEVQLEPRGIAEAFIIGEEFIGNDSVCLALGDNLIFGHDLTLKLRGVRWSIEEGEGAAIFGCYVTEPQKYGVLNIDQEGNVLSIIEKPKNPESNFAVPGIYFFNSNVVSYVKTLKPSKRNELEITDLLNIYLSRGKLSVGLLGRGYAWFDCGTPEDLLDASNFVRAIESRQGVLIGCIEEIAYNNGWITKDELATLLKEYPKTNYYKHLQKLLDDS